MTEPNDIPVGSYKLELGSSFMESKRGSTGPTFHTLRYDFKPGSVANETETYIGYGANGDVHVAMPSEGENLSVFKGSKKEAKPKECLLFFDRKTNTVRLEKISSNIQVKKTRDVDPATEASLRNGIERLRASSTQETRTPPKKEQRERESSTSSSSSSGSGSESSSDEESDNEKKNDSSESDDDESALVNELNALKPKTEMQAPVQQRAPPPAENLDPKSITCYGLSLSESSEDDEP
ncbi:unnamed protein product [Caenorhabditis bovis]|uniref:Ell-associated factor Eaf n=1 Tax=Caenorhabditis bovis TaxID=2654633 RepID=A0A8S1F9C9_9PELO|nr:unnamed protein product [Caenorhabditis bovis]